jgi:hypothetical protein
MVAVTKWFISTLFGSYRKRCETNNEKKPFNPILGEVFMGEWSSKDPWESASLVVEQGLCY